MRPRPGLSRTEVRVRRGRLDRAIAKLLDRTLGKLADSEM